MQLIVKQCTQLIDNDTAAQQRSITMDEWVKCLFPCLLISFHRNRTTDNHRREMSMSMKCMKFVSDKLLLWLLENCVPSQ